MNNQDATEICVRAQEKVFAWMRSLYAAHPELEASSNDTRGAAAEAMAWGILAGISRQRSEILLQACGAGQETTALVTREMERVGRSLPGLDILRLDGDST